MANLTILLPILLGCIGILQGAVNGQISNTIGVTQAVLITNIVCLIICIVFYFFVRSYAHLVPEFFQLKAPLLTYKWWYIFPALFGFLIIAGMPYAIAKLGAVKVTVGLIAAQMVTSVLWDIMVEDISLNIMKFIGIIFAFLSVTFITLSKT
ncbi:MAG: DMT family transporter [Bacteriovorax sp.]|jgi:transporter family-2 protein